MHLTSQLENKFGKPKKRLTMQELGQRQSSQKLAMSALIWFLTCPENFGDSILKTENLSGGVNTADQVRLVQAHLYTKTLPMFLVVATVDRLLSKSAAQKTLKKIFCGREITIRESHRQFFTMAS